MNNFKESLKVSEEETKKLQQLYEKHKQERNKRVIENTKWQNAKKRMEGEER